MERLLLVVLPLAIPTTHVTAFHHARVRCDELSTQTPSNIMYTVFDLISEHTLISGHPSILCWWRLLPEHVEISVYFMLINHSTDGATRGLTLRVRLKKKKLFLFWPKKL